MCHAFDPDAKDGHDLLIGLNSGDGKLKCEIAFLLTPDLDALYRGFYSFVIVVYTVSLRQQLQDVSKKLVGALHYNKDGSANNRQEFFSICV